MNTLRAEGINETIMTPRCGQCSNDGSVLVMFQTRPRCDALVSNQHTNKGIPNLGVSCSTWKDPLMKFISPTITESNNVHTSALPIVSTDMTLLLYALPRLWPFVDQGNGVIIRKDLVSCGCVSSAALDLRKRSLGLAAFRPLPKQATTQAGSWGKLDSGTPH